MNDRERITRLEIRCEQLQLTVNEAFHWIDILKSDLSDLQDRVGQADRKTEPQTNADQHVQHVESVEADRKTEQTAECPFDDAIPCEWACTEYGKCKYKTEPTISKMEQVDEPQTERSE